MALFSVGPATTILVRFEDQRRDRARLVLVIECDVNGKRRIGMCDLPSDGVFRLDADADFDRCFADPVD